MRRFPPGWVPVRFRDSWMFTVDGAQRTVIVMVVDADTREVI